jgi:hypothetical protein
LVAFEVSHVRKIVDRPLLNKAKKMGNKARPQEKVPRITRI